MGDERGEAKFGAQDDVQCVVNPFMKLSNDLVEHWSASITETAAKTWHTTASNIDHQQKQELFLQDFLNAILPPIPIKITKHIDADNDEVLIIDDNDTQETDAKVDDGDGNEEKGEEGIAYSLVSTEQTKRSEINQMSTEYNAQIKQRRARKVGLDDIRYELSFHLMDELIRQIAIDCKERGLMLLRIRDEAKVTLQSYAVLKDVASTFSTNIGEESIRGFEELNARKRELLATKKALENKRVNLENQMRDKQKEVEVLAQVQQQQLAKHKQAMESHAHHLRMLIDTKGRRGTGRARRNSHHANRMSKSTRRQSTVNKDGGGFNFGTQLNSPSGLK